MDFRKWKDIRNADIMQNSENKQGLEIELMPREWLVMEVVHLKECVIEGERELKRRSVEENVFNVTKSR